MPTDGTEVAERVDAILEALVAAGHRAGRGRRRSPTTCCATVHDEELLEFLRDGVRTRWARRPVRGPGRPGPGGALPVPDAGDDRRPAGPAGGRGARRRRSVRLRHDDPGRSRHLGGGPGRGRLRARRPRDLVAGGERAGLRPVPSARPPRDARRLRRLLLPQQRRRRGRGAARRAASAGSAIVDIDAHHGNGTAAIFYDRADVLYGSVHVDPGAGWFPHVVGLRRRDRRRRRARVRPATCRCAAGTGDEPWLAAVRRPRRVGHRRRQHRARRLARRRRRRRRPGEPVAGHARRATARPARSWDRPRCRPWWSRRAATTCRRWAGWSRRTFRGMAEHTPGHTNVPTYDPQRRHHPARHRLRHLPAEGRGRRRRRSSSALEIGYRLLDTAVNYENEAEVGEALRRSGVPRDEVQVASKLPGRHHAYDDAIASVHGSLERLGLDHLDLAPDPLAQPQRRPVRRGLAGARRPAAARGWSARSASPTSPRRTSSGSSTTPA